MKWARSLKNLRKIIGKNQTQFAELAGVSTDLIKSVESGRAMVTQKLGSKIQLATGATIGESKLSAHGFGPYEPLPGNAVVSSWTKSGGVAFSLLKFKRHRAAYQPDHVNDMANTLTALFKAASGPEERVKVEIKGKGGEPSTFVFESRWPFSKVAGLRWSFMEWAREASERFKLPSPSPLASALPVRPRRDASKSSRAPRRRWASR
jgi:transcriptional regulator with XRE-family HTH domain